MNNINSITALITALRSETQERSITPERVGALLQQLANLIAHCTTDTEFNPIYENAVLNIQGSVSRTANGMTLNLTLLDSLEVDTPVNISIPLATASAAGVLSATDYATIMNAVNNMGSSSGSSMTDAERTKLNTLAAHFVRLGNEGDVWRSSASAEDEAKKLEYCGNPEIWVIYYYVVGSKFGLIEQRVCDDTCIQTLHWDSKILQRTITFTNTDRTAISDVGAWTEMALPTKNEMTLLAKAADYNSSTFAGSEQNQQYRLRLTLQGIVAGLSKVLDVNLPAATTSAMGLMSAADKTKLNSLPSAADLAADNFGIRFIGHVGNASSTGENIAATLEYAGNTKLIWIIYTYSSYTAMIHQTHNGTTTVQDMYFAGNRLSRRTITFTSAQRTEISSVGAWTSVGTDIGVTRTDTTATIKIPHPFMEKNAGLLSLVIGQANATYAGLMTKENLRTLNYVDETVTTMFDDVNELKNTISMLQSTIQGIQDYVNNLSQYYVLKPYLLVVPNPATINIPVNQTSSSGGTVRNNVNVQINLTAYDENENTVDVMDCNVTWRFSPANEGTFTVEHESMKRYVTLFADAGDTWSGTEDTKLIITVTNLNNNVSGEVEVLLHRVTT